MKINLLIASPDAGYVQHISDVLLERHSDTFNISICSSTAHLGNMIKASKYDVALVEPAFMPAIGPDAVRMVLLLMDESADGSDYVGTKKIRKYQRISSIAGIILEHYAEVGSGAARYDASRAHVTAVWSPSGGAGKTTVALAYAANRVLSGKKAVYLNLENFSSTPLYFREEGRSISKAFEKLESDLYIFLTGIRQQDSHSGITFFSGPENYDDINILTADDVEKVIDAASTDVDELIVDLSSQCDGRTKRIFDIANAVFMVTDPSSTSQVKTKQFLSQHSIFGEIQSKLVMVNNKGARTTDPGISKTIQLPLLQSSDPVSIYKNLSGGNINW